MSLKPFLLIVLIGSIIISCTPKSETADQENDEAAEWKEMDDFHMVMAESFHPYRDSANIEPAKKYALEMATLAEQWSNGKLPERVDNEMVKKQLKELQESTAALVDLVEMGDEEAIGAALTGIHDTFHHIQEAWYKKEHH